MATEVNQTTITEHEAGQVARANASGLTPVMFVHGLWLLPSSWDRWAGLFEEAGYVAVRPAGPTTPRPSRRPTSTPRCSRGNRSARSPTTSAPSPARPASRPYRPLVRRPADPDPGRPRPGRRVGGDRPGAVPRRAAAPISALSQHPRRWATRPTGTARSRSATTSSATRSPTRCAEQEAKQLYQTYAVPAAGLPLFQAAAANLNPWTEAKVDTENPDRGPLLIIPGRRTTPSRGRLPMPPTSTRSATRRD